MGYGPMDEHVDADILPIVKMLAEKGFNTTWSCQGGEGHSVDNPTIRLFYGGGVEPRHYMNLIRNALQEDGHLQFRIGFEEVYDGGTKLYSYYLVEFNV